MKLYNILCKNAAAIPTLHAKNIIMFVSRFFPQKNIELLKALTSLGRFMYSQLNP